MVPSMTIYILAVLAANYTATWFIPLPIFGMVSVGTLIFGITFTQRDRVHRYGRKAVYAMILLAAVGMVLESLLLELEGSPKRPLRVILVGLRRAKDRAEAANTLHPLTRMGSWVVLSEKGPLCFKGATECDGN